MEILIKCNSGFKSQLSDFYFQSEKLKQHSDLEINRLVESIKNEGFLFPVVAAKIDDKLYIVDGECRVLALYELRQQGYEIPEIPYCLTRATKDTLKKITIFNCSTNHSVTQVSLESYCKETNIDLKNFGFNSPDLIDFRTIKDIDLYDSSLGGKFVAKGIELKKEDFVGLLSES